MVIQLALTHESERGGIFERIREMEKIQMATSGGSTG